MAWQTLAAIVIFGPSLALCAVAAIRMDMGKDY